MLSCLHLKIFDYTGSENVCIDDSVIQPMVMVIVINIMEFMMLVMPLYDMSHI
jgi:hypothetical protein